MKKFTAGTYVQKFKIKVNVQFGVGVEFEFKRFFCRFLIFVSKSLFFFNYFLASIPSNDKERLLKYLKNNKIEEIIDNEDIDSIDGNKDKIVAEESPSLSSSNSLSASTSNSTSIPFSSSLSDSSSLSLSHLMGQIGRAHVQVRHCNYISIIIITITEMITI